MWHFKQDGANFENYISCSECPGIQCRYFFLRIEAANEFYAGENDVDKDAEYLEVS